MFKKEKNLYNDAKQINMETWILRYKEGHYVEFL